MYRVSFTGYRPQKLPFFGEDDPLCVELKQRIYKEIKRLCEEGSVEFYCGMALGVDIWCAEAVLDIQKQFPKVELIAVIPCKTQSSVWGEKDQARYNDIIAKCSRVLCVSEEYTKSCMKKRNETLVKLCDVLIAVYDGKPGGTRQTVKIAEKQAKRIITISPM